MIPLVALMAFAQAGSHARAQLVADVSAIEPGKPFLAAVVIDTDPGWHVYWTNPGDSGIPTTVEWKLPTGWKIESLRWPTPKTFESGGIVGYGYEGETLFLTRITPPANAKKADLKANVRWLVCQEACIPGSANLSLSLPAGTMKPSATWQTRIAGAQASLPKPAEGWSFQARKTQDGYDLVANTPADVLVKGEPQFFALDSGVIAHDAPQPATLAEGKITLRLKRNQYASGIPKSLKGLLVAPTGKTWPNGAEAIVVEAPISNGEQT